MQTIFDISARLKQAATEQKISIAHLQRVTGLSALTIAAALQGKKDAQISTLLTLAHHLDLAFALLPKHVADVVQAQSDASQRLNVSAISWVEVSTAR